MAQASRFQDERLKSGSSARIQGVLLRENLATQAYLFPAASRLTGSLEKYP